MVAGTGFANVSNEQIVTVSAADTAATANDSTPDMTDLNRRIDDIVAFQKRKDPWYKDTAVMISAAAFFISIVTSTISAYRTHQQDVNSLKDSLHNIIRLYHAVNMHTAELRFTALNDLPDPFDARGDPDNPRAKWSREFDRTLSNATATENALLTKQAYSLAHELGKDASSVDLGEVGSILYETTQLRLSESILNDASNRAENLVERVGALRGLGQTQFLLGKRDESNATMNQALNVFADYPEEAKDPNYLHFTQVFTYLFWIGFVGTQDCELSKKNLADAIRSNSLTTTPLASQSPKINRAREDLAGCPDNPARKVN
jgi:hypothetical protein